MSDTVKQSKKYEIDMCNGPLFGKILLFTLPLMLSGILFFYCLALAVVLAIIFNTRKENQK